MRLYHFTAFEYLPAIMRDGLTKGDVPLGPTKSMNAVWLTVDDEPDVQGWAGSDHVLTDEERELHGRIYGAVPPPGARFPNKQAVLLAVEVPDSDPLLVRWARFARVRGLNRKWLRTINAKRFGRAADWYIYRGEIPVEWIKGVAPLSDEARASFDAHVSDNGE